MRSSFIPKSALACLWVCFCGTILFIYPVLLRSVLALSSPIEKAASVASRSSSIFAFLHCLHPALKVEEAILFIWSWVGLWVAWYRLWSSSSMPSMLSVWFFSNPNSKNVYTLMVSSERNGFSTIDILGKRWTKVSFSINWWIGLSSRIRQSLFFYRRAAAFSSKKLLQVVWPMDWIPSSES